MNKIFPKLFERGQIGRMTVKNRIIKAPTQTRLCARDGSVTDRLVRHYRETARGGVGLIIVEHTWVNHRGSQSTVCQLGVADDTYIGGLSLLARGIQNEGARACLQIAHCGRQMRLGTNPIKAPSRVLLEELHIHDESMFQELTLEEIQEVIKDFGNAARRAKLAGFDMVEIHGAHGYLITSFLSPRTNKRTDKYGGSRKNRMRFLTDIVADVRTKVGADFPVSVRLSGTEYEPDGVMIEDTIEVAKALEKLGVNLIHISGGNHHQTIYQISPMIMPRGTNVWAAEAVKKAVRIPVAVSGSIVTPDFAEEILEKGQADFISLGRPLWADPCWPLKAKEGRPEDIAPCIRCNDGCLERAAIRFSAVSCTVNAAAGEEDTFIITPSAHPKKVAVIGGGPAGMEAARICSLRGHDVTLYEKRKLGGALIEASVPEFKADIRRLVDYLAHQMKKLKVKVIYKEADIDTIRNEGFDAVIVAVGGKLRKLDIPGIDKPLVTDVMEVLGGRASTGRRVNILGGGLVGAEVGLFLAEQGREVTITPRPDDPIVDLTTDERLAYKKKLDERNVIVTAGKILERVLDDGVVVIGTDGRKENIPADTVVLNPGFVPQTSLVEELERETDLEVYAVGDCVSPRRIFDAIHEGHRAAFLIR